jgi:hypothetical protein
VTYTIAVGQQEQRHALQQVGQEDAERQNVGAAGRFHHQGKQAGHGQYQAHPAHHGGIRSILRQGRVQQAFVDHILSGALLLPC